jgi:hypothetical protein
VLTSILAAALVVKLAAADRVGRETKYAIGFDNGFLESSDAKCPSISIRPRSG